MSIRKDQRAFALPIVIIMDIYTCLGHLGGSQHGSK